MKLVVFFSGLCFLLHSQFSIAFGSNPYGTNPEDYLLSKAGIAYVVKVSGPVTYMEYSNYFQELTPTRDPDQIKSEWSNYAKNTDEVFVVIKLFKGDGLTLGRKLIITPGNQHYSETRIGEKYIVFFDKVGESFIYEGCDFADIESASIPDRKLLLMSDLNHIVHHVVNKNYLHCMEEAIP